MIDSTTVCGDFQVDGPEGGRPFGFVLTGGEASDYQAVDELMALPVANPKHMLADKAVTVTTFVADF